MQKIIVVGGGPAGMIAAITAAEHGAEVILLEKKEQVGKKLKITGKGRCNITSADVNNFIAGYAKNGHFLYSALNEFSNFDLIEFFNKRGLMTKVERGKRVFPVTDNADDVVKVLYETMKRLGVAVYPHVAIDKMGVVDKKLVSVSAGNDNFPCDAVIVATGGMSYPGTGSTGDGYKWAKSAGHTLIEPRPALVPLVVQEGWIKELQGLSLKNVQVNVFQDDGKKIGDDFGEMLFTHYGVSGPIILSLSRKIGDYLATRAGNAQLIIDYKPGLTVEQLENRLQRDFEKYSRKQFKNALDDLLPQKLIPVIIKLSGIDAEKPVHQITREERKEVLDLLKKFTLTITATRSFKEAVVTAGGVEVKEIDPKTMQSKLVEGLFFAGEILDIDGYTGGYNLQAAFSTGYVAGKYASKLYG
ncbi:MAG TPA: NAD(P)/FAD-dependent oxidoreductase [Syntrophomonadaceae bacterium]|nr:NAD(P)/FAD-dependent oxidoreductase [Syntrophomonadaceae bacterium]